VLNPLLRQKGIKSMVGAPLLTRGRVLGVVHVGSLTYRRFDPDDIELLQLAADRAALGLERALVHEQLLRLEELKHEFISTAAHELRTPASVLIGVAATLRERRATLGEETKEQLLDLLYDASTRLGHLLEELLDFSRVESRMLVPDASPVEIRTLIEDVAQEVAPGGIAGLEIYATPETTLVTDESILRRILANLLKNSLLHGEPPIQVRVAQSEGQATVTIEDSGPGVPQGFVDRLFDPFARANPAEGKPGAGLGLAIANSYTRRLGGELAYEEREPTGARFSLRLPQTEPASAHA
jgi:signal transduction histidine kinase